MRPNKASGFMKSGKERAKVLRARRAAKREKYEALKQKQLLASKVLVNHQLLAPTNSYGRPLFFERGYYLDAPFKCKDCGKEEVWSASQQKWWYEVAKGDMFTEAARCRACRQKEKARRDEARRPH